MSEPRYDDIEIANERIQQLYAETNRIAEDRRTDIAAHEKQIAAIKDEYAKQIAYLKEQHSIDKEQAIQAAVAAHHEKVLLPIIQAEEQRELEAIQAKHAARRATLKPTE